MVAWDGGREVARTVHDALPLLAEAEVVTVVQVAPAQRESSYELPSHFNKQSSRAVFVDKQEEDHGYKVKQRPVDELK